MARAPGRNDHGGAPGMGCEVPAGRLRLWHRLGLGSAPEVLVSAAPPSGPCLGPARPSVSCAGLAR
jgi:hypothetical protein